MIDEDMYASMPEEMEHGYDLEEDFDDLAEAEMIPPEFTIDNLLPVGIVFLAAPPKAGKSTITIAAACLVAEYGGTALPDDMRTVTQAGPVMIFSAEAQAGEIRFMAENGLGVQLQANKGILVAKRPEEFRIDQETGMKRVMDALNARKPKLVILDPLRNFHGEDENDAGEMLRMLAPLRRWAVDNKSTFIVVHHTAKPKEGQTDFKANDMRGSSALFGIADGVIICSPSDVPQQITIEATFKRAKGWKRKIVFGAYENQGKTGDVMNGLDKNILGVLTSGEVPTIEDLAARLNSQPDKVRESLEKLVRNKRVVFDGKDWVIA